MNSRDDKFQERIDAAARSLKRPSSDGDVEQALAVLKAKARDLDAAIDVAARSLEGKAPLDLLDLRIAAAARELKRPAPEGLYASIRAQARRSRFTVLRSTVVVRGAVALAAALLVGVTLYAWFTREASASPNPALLTAAALEASRSAEARLSQEATRIEQRVSSDAALADNDVAQSLMEELAFVDQAIEQCKAGLAMSAAHSHLRERLVELASHRLDLLHQIEAAGKNAGGTDGEGHG